MVKKMCSFRIRPDVLLKLHTKSRLSGLSQAEIIELALVYLFNHVSAFEFEKKYHLVMLTLVSE